MPPTILLAMDISTSLYSLTPSFYGTTPPAIKGRSSQKRHMHSRQHSQKQLLVCQERPTEGLKM